jgi:phosphoglycolate phosphatase
MRSAGNRVTAVLFDLDGTLVDSGIDFGRMRQELLELASEWELAVPPGMRNGDILAIRDDVCARAADPEEALSLAEARLVAIEREALERSHPVPGAEALLGELRRRGVRIGIVTRNCREIAEDALRHGLFYDALVARADTPRVKPHPDHLLRAIAKLEVERSEAMMVGDGRMDVEAGRAAGLRTVGYLTMERPADYFADLDPDLVIRHLDQLIPWIFPSSS